MEKSAEFTIQVPKDPPIVWVTAEGGDKMYNEQIYQKDVILEVWKALINAGYESFLAFPNVRQQYLLDIPDGGIIAVNNVCLDSTARLSWLERVLEHVNVRNNLAKFKVHNIKWIEEEEFNGIKARMNKLTTTTSSG